MVKEKVVSDKIALSRLRVEVDELKKSLANQLEVIISLANRVERLETNSTVLQPYNGRLT